MRDTPLSNKEAMLFPINGDQVLRQTPSAVLASMKKGAAPSKVAGRVKRRLMEQGDEAQIDFMGVLASLDNDDMMGFLAEGSRRYENAVADIIQEQQGTPSLSPVISVSPTASPSARAPRPNPR